MRKIAEGVYQVPAGTGGVCYTEIGETHLPQEVIIRVGEDGISAEHLRELAIAAGEDAPKETKAKAKAKPKAKDGEQEPPEPAATEAPAESEPLSLT